MLSQQYSKIAIPLKGGGYFLLGIQAADFDRSASEEGFIELQRGCRGWLADNGAIEVIGENIEHALRLKETLGYCWAIDGNNEIINVNSSLESSRRQRWSVERYNKIVERGAFCIVNHLGYTKFQLMNEGGLASLSLQLEFISPKIDFHTEYRQMTEDIAAFCEQLLLSATAPTSLKFSSTPSEQRKVLLESFIFLRHFLSPERLQWLSELIQRNPHSALVSEREWKPMSMVKSSHHLSNPNAMLRDWRNINGTSMPTQGLNIRREESHNTPPNQFVKFALLHFRKITTDVLNLKSIGSTIRKQAEELQVSIDSTLAHPFYKNLPQLKHLPLNNQTLQKREGYREFLRGWILVESACSLDWQGQQDCFQGETRDVATLYEYWLFLEIHKILASIDGITHITSNPIDDSDRFIKHDAGAISIQLKQGKNSQSSFLYQPDAELDGVRIDLHYEKTFSHSESATSGQSYSRQFRPDYTLSLFPDRYKTEAAAAHEGKVAHLHFDAKYRIQNLQALFGEDHESTDDAITQEKLKNKVSSYKRVDLLKMHTYNDALRKTIGSYVLYPGTGSEHRSEFKKFHEIAPSVGAHIMKPGNPECANSLKSFLIDVLNSQRSQFTQHSYIRDANHAIIENKPTILEEESVSYDVARKNAPCVLLWLKKSNSDIFRENGFAYCHAVPRNQTESHALDLNLSTEIGSEFIPCGGRQGEPISSLGWRAKVTSARFMAKQKLELYLQHKGLLSQLQPSSTAHYLVFEFDHVSKFAKQDLSAVHQKYRSGSKYMAVTCSWADILEASS
ncbi:DUF2357 domain-containing protein [Persicirhabdus sediminis]|uniref:DUF2357 domain-containing protein n=1 Tax=Persicirhabdus sediminis TaxID=454144 RepID=A0A8J7MEY5_9BACT|nr:DUF2357 domain-containing protein [Persicirhabdus sediminis]MBK1791438.1 DUF2357 domain-containing protein [Persicirhabdus sediminis]